MENWTLIQVSESTQKVIKAAFGMQLRNPARLQVRKSYPFPAIEDTRCPKLDRVLKQNLTKDVKDTDASASEPQILTLDAAAPLVHILEEAQRGTLTTKMAVGGAGVYLSPYRVMRLHTRRATEKAGTEGPKQRPTTSCRGQEAFRRVAPLLFGNDFEKKD